MYRSVVLTSVRQFTDPGSPTTCLELPASPTLAEEMDPSDLTVDTIQTDGQDSFFDEEMVENRDVPIRSPSVDTLGYFNAAFEDFDEQEREAYQEEERLSPSRSGLEVIRGNTTNDFNEEEEDMIIESSSTSSKSSSDSNSASTSSTSEPSESSSVKYLPMEVKEEQNAKGRMTLQVEEDNSFVIEVTSSQLPSPEIPSMEILNSRPITPEDFLTPEEEKSILEGFQEANQAVQPTDQAAHQELIDQNNQKSFEQAIMDRFTFDQPPGSSRDGSEYPAGTDTPPPTPAFVDPKLPTPPDANSDSKTITSTSFSKGSELEENIEDTHPIISPVADAVALDGIGVESHSLSGEPTEIDDTSRHVVPASEDQVATYDVEEIPFVSQDPVASDDVAEGLISADATVLNDVVEDKPVVISEDSTIPSALENIDSNDGDDDKILELVREHESVEESTEIQSIEEEEMIIDRSECPLDQDPSPATEENLVVEDDAGSILLTGNQASVEDAHDLTAQQVSAPVNSVKLARKVSRDEGTQTDFCGHTGRLHATPLIQTVELVQQSIIQSPTIPLQVDGVEMAATKTVTSDTLQEVQCPDPVESNETGTNSVTESDETTQALSAPISDGDVFVTNVAQVKPDSKGNHEDEDSFYGSDKEIDGEVVFSHTDSSTSSSSSSSGSDIESVEPVVEAQLIIYSISILFNNFNHL